MNSSFEVLKSTQRRIFKWVAGIDAALILLSIFFLEDPKAFALGLIFGSAISALNFLELSNTLKRAVQMQPPAAQRFAAFKYFIRYLVTGVAVYVAIRAPYINVLGTIVGLVLIKVIILVQNAVEHRQSSK